MTRPVPETVAKRRPEALTPKQQRFVAEYLIDLNATGAARRAGYRGRTEGVLRKTAWRLMHETPAVTEAIEAGRTRVAEENELTVEKVVEELRMIGLAPIKDAQGWGPGGINVKRLALVDLGKHIGMWPGSRVGAQDDGPGGTTIKIIGGLPDPE